MAEQDYLDSNHYETEMLRPEDDIDPHQTVDGLPDDRMNTDSDFEVNPELSSTNL